ncbi:hypothetical protein B7494_g8506 [Chlorociboria aeruginascens]|nr:hypothetical protein B7494_g8506 [Chlorociboria aeruginascens]
MPNIMYIDDLLQSPDIGTEAEYISDMRQQGFIVNHDTTISLSYHSNNHEDALKKLMHPSKLLILDCFTALQLAYFQAYLEVLGTKALSALLYRTKLKFPCSGVEKVKAGHVVFIHGPRCAASFHPISHLNGHYTICTDVTPNGPRFTGFDPKRPQIQTYDEIKNYMENAFKQKLTYIEVADMKYLKNTFGKDKPDKETTLTHEEAWDMLCEENSERKCEYRVEVYNTSNGMNAGRKTDIIIPTQYLRDAVLGPILQHSGMGSLESCGWQGLERNEQTGSFAWRAIIRTGRSNAPPPIPRENPISSSIHPPPHPPSPSLSLSLSILIHVWILSFPHCNLHPLKETPYPAMAYDAVDQHDHASPDDTHSISSSPYERVASSAFEPLSLGLFLDGDTSHDASRLNLDFMALSNISKSTDTKTTTSYDMLDGDDYADDATDSPVPSPPKQKEPFVSLNIPRPLPRRPQATTASSHHQSPSSPQTTTPIRSDPLVRTASGRSIALRHPTPDLQVLQGAYTGNIEHLERTAERLSMTSSIDDAIRDLHMEQKRSDSRRSSLLSSQGMHTVTRQISNAGSIVEVNSAARSGGYSPAGYMMSPKDPFPMANRERSASKSSRFSSRPEPELEGRPLDLFVSSTHEPSLVQSSPIAEQYEGPPTLTLPALQFMRGNNVEEELPQTNEHQHEPSTPASTTTFEAQLAFADFDGTHTEPQPRPLSEQEPATTQRRFSTGNRLSTARPLSYADPMTGQNMVYYPAPVPMMLNLPQKLSNRSSVAQNKRRSQVLSAISQADRHSTTFLPDVIESPNGDLEDALQQGYLPQHQRTTMGGRRTTEDLSHLPPQLRASAFFDLPSPTQVVEIKEQSAVATLDSILDASAHAPVTAFTDHAFAGHLGAEVYGRTGLKNSRSSTQILATPVEDKKRNSIFNLRGRRSSSGDLLDSQKRSSAMPTVSDDTKPRQPIDDDDEISKENTPLNQSEDGLAEVTSTSDQEEEAEEEEGGNTYHGAPTTLLAELQLRKQQQKIRTRPVASAYPNGLHSTLLELDAVAQVEQKARKQKRVNLAWEDPLAKHMDSDTDDDEVPLAMLYASKPRVQEPNRPLGLMERREMEDSEPLSRRRDRLQGRPAMPRASTMMNLSGDGPEEEGETLAERIRMLKGEQGIDSPLPAARPVSGDFASEMMSQFGGDPGKDVKGQGKEGVTPVGEEEETLGQRRKRLQAERNARALEVGTLGLGEERLVLGKKRSLANILQAHPTMNGGNGVVSQGKPVSGLLGLHEKQSMQRANTMQNMQVFPASQPPANGFKNGLYNDGQGGIIPQQNYNLFSSSSFQPQFPQPSVWNNGMMPFGNPYAMGNMNMGYMPNGMNGMANPMANMMYGGGMGVQPLNQGQIDMVERWRQSVMQ